MALITNNISGSESGNSRIGITGSVIISNSPGSAFPTIGTDTVFFVSGSETSKSVFGGAAKVSGSLSTDGNVVLGDSIADNTTVSGTSTFSGLSSFIGGLETNNISGSAAGASKIGITGSVIFANVPNSSFPSLPTDTVFYVSGSKNGTNRSVFTGDVVLSGTTYVGTAQDGGAIEVIGHGGITMMPYNTAPGATSEIRFKELAANGGNYVALKGPDNIASNYHLALPAADGLNGHVLKTDGSGNTSFVDASTVVTGTVSLIKLTATSGLSGSLTKLADGTSYLIAGTGMTVTTGSTGAVTIATTATTMNGGNGSNDNVITADGSGGLVAESNLNFNGSALDITGSIIASNLSSSDRVLITSGSTRTISQAANLIYDSTNAYLGIAVATPARNLHVNTGARFGSTNYIEFVGANATIWRWAVGGTITTVEHGEKMILLGNRGNQFAFNASETTAADIGFSRAASGILNVSGSAPGAIFRFNATSTPTAAGDMGMNIVTGRPNALIDGVVQQLAHINEIAPITASYVVLGADTTLTNERILTAGSGISITDGGAGSTVTIAATGTGGGADPGASYVVMSATGSLANERVLTAGTGLTLTDGGANNNATLAINDGVVATVSGTIFTGPVAVSGSTFGTSTTTTLNLDSGTGGINIGNNAAARTTNIATPATTVQTVNIGNRVDGSNINLYSSGTLGVGIKTHTGYTGSDSRTITGAVTTTGNTATTIASISGSAGGGGTVWWVEGTFVGHNATSTFGMGVRHACFYLNAAANSMNQQGSTNNTVSIGQIPGSWTVGLSASGTNIIAQVTGQASTTIDWTCTLRYQAVSGSA